MGLVPMQKNEGVGMRRAVFGREFLNIGQLDMAGYITSTGSSWAGNVEKATFKLITVPFEKYFERRGITEETGADMSSEEAEEFNSSFPVRHPLWFKQIEPGGSTTIEGGVQWQYKDYKPKEPIVVRYYTTPFPQMPDEADAFVDTFLKTLGKNESVSDNLRRLKQVVLAAYGKEPDDATAKAFALEQLWYKPRRDFALEQLTKGQTAVLQKIDQRIASELRKSASR